MDNVIDVNVYPDQRIEKMAKGNRKIGLGIMGWAELLIRLGIPYSSKEALSIAEKVMSFISKKAFEASVKLAHERGSFPNVDRSVYKGKLIRNATRTSIAPTGTISMIAETTPSIEPLFAVAYEKEVLDGRKVIYVEPLLMEYAKNLSESEIERIIEEGSVRNVEGLSENFKKVFITALEIPPEWHLKMQATFQNYVDNAVSKTINLPEETTVEEIEKIFIMGFKEKLKGITVFRHGSKRGVIEFGVKRKVKCHC